MSDKAPRAALWAALPALVIALTGWLQAQTAATAVKQEKAAMGDNYQGYVEDRLKRDEALQAAVDRLRLRLMLCEHGQAQAAMPTRSMAPKGALAMRLGEVAGPVDLDELARAEGYRYER